MRQVTFDYSSIEQRILALEGPPKKQLRKADRPTTRHRSSGHDYGQVHIRRA
jgi:hypothetical protein